MKHTYLAAVVFVAVLVGVVLYTHYDTEDKSSAPPDYGYRCGDGSEFTVVPSGDMTSIRVVPATSVDYLRETMLSARPGDEGKLYTGGGVTVRVAGSTIELSTATTAPTTCTSMRPAEESLFYSAD